MTKTLFPRARENNDRMVLLDHERLLVYAHKKVELQEHYIVAQREELDWRRKAMLGHLVGNPNLKPD